MTTIIRNTLGEVLVDVLRRVNDRVEKFTATAGGAATIDGAAPLSTTADFYNTDWLYIFKGTSAGDERNISDYGQGATYRFTADGNFTATPDTTSEAVVTTGIRPSVAYDAVLAAIRRCAQFFPRPLTDTSMRMGNILWNGGFQFWDGASAVSVGSYIYTAMGASIGWKTVGTGGTFTRESTIVPLGDVFGRHSGKIVSDGTNKAYYEWNVPNYQQYAGKTLTVKGLLYTATGSRVWIQVFDGVNTYNTDTGGTSGKHSGTAGWEELSNTECEIDDNPTELTVRAGVIEDGDAVTAYVGDVRLFVNSAFDRIVRIPPWFDYVDRISLETGTPGRYSDQAVRSEDYQLHHHPDGHLYIRFDLHMSQDIVADRRVMLEGAGYRTDTITVTTTTDLNPILLSDYAVVELLQGISLNPGQERAFALAQQRIAAFENPGGRGRAMRGHAK